MIVSRAVRGLEDQGRLVREGSDTDRRMRHLYLTDDGWAVYDKVARRAGARGRDLFAAQHERAGDLPPPAAEAVGQGAHDDLMPRGQLLSRSRRARRPRRRLAPSGSFGPRQQRAAVLAAHLEPRARLDDDEGRAADDAAADPQVARDDEEVGQRGVPDAQRAACAATASGRSGAGRCRCRRSRTPAAA